MTRLHGTAEAAEVALGLSATPATPPATATYRPHPFQRALDLVGAAALGVVTLPAVAVAGALVKLTSAGPVFYTQVRAGRDGVPFHIVKLRTMYDQCESVSGIVWSQAGDKRITPVGKWLRKLHVDELPQVWNVLCGDMSLVGPRPERPEIIAELAAEIPNYADRQAVRPGLTGLAQIQAPPDASVETVKRKLGYDLAYITRRGLWTDLKIAFGTGLYLTGLSYRAVRVLAGLPAVEPAPAPPTQG